MACVPATGASYLRVWLWLCGLLIEAKSRRVSATKCGATRCCFLPASAASASAADCPRSNYQGSTSSKKTKSTASQTAAAPRQRNLPPDSSQHWPNCSGRKLPRAPSCAYRPQLDTVCKPYRPTSRLQYYPKYRRRPAWHGLDRILGIFDLSG